MSSSRGCGAGEIWWASSISSSVGAAHRREDADDVVPRVARGHEPPRDRLSRSGPATEVPPNFWTTRPMPRRYVNRQRAGTARSPDRAPRRCPKTFSGHTCSSASRGFARATRALAGVRPSHPCGRVERLCPALVAERLRRRHRAYPCTGPRRATVSARLRLGELSAYGQRRGRTSSSRSAQGGQ